MIKTPIEILCKLLEKSNYIGMDKPNGDIEIKTNNGSYLLKYVCNSDSEEHKMYSLIKLYGYTGDTNGYLFVCEPIPIEFIQTAIKKQTPENDLIDELFEDDVAEQLIGDKTLEEIN